jgi:hypothetical protein
LSRKRTVRRVWDKVNPIEHAMKGAAITPRADLDRLLARELSALEEFTHGRAGMAQWHDLANVVNLCETLAHQRVGAEALEACRRGQDALIEAAQRFLASRRMGLSGPGIQALRDCIEYHDLQRASIPRSQYEAAIRLTAARVKSGFGTVDLGDLEPQPERIAA